MVIPRWICFLITCFSLLISFNGVAQAVSLNPPNGNEEQITKVQENKTNKKEAKGNEISAAEDQNNNTAEDTATDYLTDEEIAEEQDMSKIDPYEKFNRVIFSFNEGLDDAILKPIAEAYNVVMPSPLNTAVDNVLENLTGIPTVINDVLQFEFYQATSDAWRLAVNSTIGIGGILDVSTKIGLQKHNEDVGLTFARWGWQPSRYFVIPFFGASTVRDAIGLPIYYYMTVYPYIPNLYCRYGAIAWRIVDIRAQLLRFTKVYKESAIDPYVFVRSAYLQRRAFLINNAKDEDDPYTEKNTEKAAADDSSETYYLEDV